MTATSPQLRPGAHAPAFVYERCDIAPGETLAAYRRRRDEHERAERHRQRRRRRHS